MQGKAFAQKGCEMLIFDLQAPVMARTSGCVVTFWACRSYLLHDFNSLRRGGGYGLSSKWGLEEVTCQHFHF